MDPGDIQDRTPLFLASSVGGTATVQLLLDRGADITLKDVELRSPLHVAIGNTPTMEALVKVIILAFNYFWRPFYRVTKPAVETLSDKLIRVHNRFVWMRDLVYL